ncbi:MAG: methylated-DNA--[protein]-cysteine S-methyltransferase [Candidatus Binataceae bacterium]
MDNMNKLDDLPLRDGGPPDAVVDEMLRAANPRLARRLQRIKRAPARAAVIDSALGRLLVAESARGLLTVTYLDTRDGKVTLAAIRQKYDVREDDGFAARVGAEIERFLNGELDAIAHRELDLSLVESDFQRRALRRLRQVSPGSVVTYQALAAAIGAPDGQRAIGNTMAANPLPIYVPCHRVIKSDGTIGNYGGGVARKLKLLRAEGFEVGRDHRLPAGAVYGHMVSHIFCRPTCQAVKRSERRKWIIFADAERARRGGMRACKLCKPA